MRYVVMIKQAMTEMKYLLHPRGVFTFRLNGTPVTNTIVHSVLGYFIIYILTVLVVTFIVTTAGIDVFSAFSASLGSIGTIGPGFGMMGPSKNYGFLPDYIKYVLAFAMLIGRLEFYTLLVIITPWFWKR